jgi:ABC-type multidrug transport system ATPase subunit
MNLALNVHNLTKQFGHILAVDNISFTVNQGEIFGFLGPVRACRPNREKNNP